MKRIPIKLRKPVIFDKQYSCPYERPYGYIYLITNEINGHMYVGQHCWNKPYIDENYWGSGKVISKVYKKYPRENFTRIIIEWIGTNQDALNDAEIYWIQIFDTFKFPQHYNLTVGGDKPPTGFGENNPNYGNRWNKEQRKKLSMLRKGERSALYGKRGKEHPAYGKRIPFPSGELHPYYKKPELNPMYGKHGKNNPNSIPVVQLNLNGELIQEHDCAKETKKFGFNPSNVTNCCKHRDGFITHKGYKWMYLSEYINGGDL